MSAPQKIWAWEYKGNTPWGPKKPNLDVVTDGAEYIRADLVQAMIEGWQHFFDTSDRLYGDTEKIEAAIDAAMRALA